MQAYSQMSREEREKAVKGAEDTLRAEYWSEVREYAKDFIEECKGNPDWDSDDDGEES